MHAKNPRLLTPTATAEPEFRAQVLFRGPVALQIQRIQAEYQIEPAAVIRLLVVDQLRAREASTKLPVPA